MKTNQVMKRENGFVQRTKDGFFNANELLNFYNENNSKSKKILGNYKATDSTNAFKNQLVKEGIEKPMITGRGRYGGTWMHPKMFIDFAMWVSVEFKSIVIDYVLDGLIQSRNDAGDYYNEMSAEILSTHLEFYGTKPNPSIYINEANIIKKLLGLKSKDRNLMTENDLSNITQMQRMNSLLLRKNIGKDSRIKQLTLQAEMLTFK